jgi:hypothetical protein
VNAFFGSRLSPHLARLSDGALLIRSTPVGRTGVQMYSPHDVSVDLPNDGKQIPVRRLPEEVFRPATVASIEGTAICNDHPPVFLDASNWRAYVCGHAQHVREGPALENGDRTLIADLVIRDAGLVEAITTGRSRDLSLGYDCEYERVNGQWTQKNIVCNHLAVVPTGRAGANISIMDAAARAISADRFGATLARVYDACPEMREDVEEVLVALSGVQDPATDADLYAAQMRRSWRK